MHIPSACLRDRRRRCYPVTREDDWRLQNRRLIRTLQVSFSEGSDAIRVTSSASSHIHICCSIEPNAAILLRMLFSNRNETQVIRD